MTNNQGNEFVIGCVIDTRNTFVRTDPYAQELRAALLKHWS